MLEKQILACEHCKSGQVLYIATSFVGRDWHKEERRYHLIPTLYKGYLPDEQYVDCTGYKEYDERQVS
jgi:hypothetical protein